MHIRHALGLLLAAALVPGLPAQLAYVEKSAGLQTPKMESGRTEMEFADVNADGYMDLISIGDHGSPFIGTQQHGLMVWFGNGGTSWTVFQYGDFGYGGVALGDVNGDGLMDAAYGMHHNYSGVDLGDQILEVALGDGTGKVWTPWDDGLATSGETWGMFGTDFADVDNDGDLDVGSISFGCCAGVHVYRNHYDGTWSQSWGFVGGNSDCIFTFGDVNGDGNADLAAAHGNGTVYLGDGQGGFKLEDGNLPPPIWRRGVDLGDVNGDGRDDLAFVTSTGAVNVWTWTGPGTWKNLSGTLPTSGFSIVQIADMNLDGHGDVLAFTSSSTGVVKVFGGDGSGNWQELTAVSLPAGCGANAFRAGTDADHNGHPDFVVVNKENCDGWGGGSNRPRYFAEASAPTSPWIYPHYPRGGEVFIAGSVRFVKWHATSAGQGVTLELSRTGPGGPWTPLTADVPGSGVYQWTVPTVPTSHDCYLRYTLHTRAGDASAVTPNAFTILGAGVLGDLNCDGAVDAFDIDAFVLALTDAAGYAAKYPDCDRLLADCSGDGKVDAFDIDPFVELLAGG
jgi:hypothetical protein